MMYYAVLGAALVGMVRCESPEDAIKTMKLYTHLQRFEHELVERGWGLDGASLDARNLNEIDMLHYHGTRAVDEASKELELDASSRVLEIGSGLGGVARRAAYTTGARVVGVELQEDVSDHAATLTERTGLSQLVEHVHGDATKPLPELEGRTFTHVISFLCLLHIPDKHAILKAAYDALEPGGSLLVEDFYDLALTKEEKHRLEIDVFAFDLPSRESYETAMADVGFQVKSWTDLTDSWTAFTRERAIAYAADEERHVRVNGVATFETQKYFVESVAALFATGHLGGVKYIASKPQSQDL